MQSKATTIEAYLAELPEDRREQISAVRDVILKNLPAGYEEAMNWGMITYQVPLEVYPDTYNKQPLLYAALASQKNHMAVYLSAVYMHEEDSNAFLAAYKETGKRLDMGKSCVRFKKIDDLPLDLIAETISRYPLEGYINDVKQVQSIRKSRN